ncbi:hypothetical protein [Azospirillum sp. SYSU D00513]|uniref:hypothetical protein n=1 Tax=Azospirillum sp. SYSU D00513 TaxID=2812561 RepID=UPI001A97C6DD|nr:hypothetical protein [Azospirillum sp. SYSU D00513]
MAFSDDETMVTMDDVIFAALPRFDSVQEALIWYDAVKLSGFHRTPRELVQEGSGAVALAYLRVLGEA